MYPDERVARFVNNEFTAVRIHVREHAAEWKRLGDRYAVHWTPTILIVDSSGEERGELPPPAQREGGRDDVDRATDQFGKQAADVPADARPLPG